MNDRVYGVMNRKDWRTVSINDVGFDPQELREMLLPVLRTDFLGKVGDFDAWAQSLVEECRSALDAILPLSGNETEFLDRVMDRGEIVPSLLTTETEMMDIYCFAAYASVEGEKRPAAGGSDKLANLFELA